MRKIINTKSLEMSAIATGQPQAGPYTTINMLINLGIDKAVLLFFANKCDSGQIHPKFFMDMPSSTSEKVAASNEDLDAFIRLANDGIAHSVKWEDKVGWKLFLEEIEKCKQ